MGNIYGPIWVSTDEYLKIWTAHELNRESSDMHGEIILAVAPENPNLTIPIHTE